MLRLLKLELGKIFKPVITTTAILTVLTCILTCVLQRDYTVYFHIDAWEIGTEYIALLFPLFVTIPVCWQLYYERRDRFIVYTLPRISKQKYLSIKWAACALSGFCILFIPYVMSLLCALYVVTPANVLPPHDKYSHFLLTLYVQFPLIYGLLLSAWKALLGVLTMTFGFVLALFSRNIFVILTAPFVYVILENFILEQVVLYEVKRLACFASEYENDFIKAMIGRSAKVAENTALRKQRELDALTARDRELDMLFERLYEDNVAGKIDDARFAKMSKRYEQEQGENAKKIKALRLELKKDESKRMDIDDFLETVRRYTDATTITKRMVAELIDHIEVYHAEKQDGVTNQRVVIYYNCIGAFDVPDRRKIPEADIIMETRKGVALSYAPEQVAV